MEEIDEIEKQERIDELERLEYENEKLKEKLNKITEIVKHKPAHTSDYVINYQSAMAQLESIIYVLKGLAWVEKKKNMLYIKAMII